MTGAEIKALREKLELSQKEFATAIGFTTPHGARAVRRLEADELAASGSALAAMRYLGAICEAMKDESTALEVLYRALPEVLREKA